MKMFIAVTAAWFFIRAGAHLLRACQESSGTRIFAAMVEGAVGAWGLWLLLGGA